MTQTQDSSHSEQYISPISAWALSFGSAVGWGAFVMPGTTFIPTAGPFGTALGMALGVFIMLLIGSNYHFMMNHYRDAGGTYSYAKHILGHDHGFLCAWFLALTYIAILWANLTALALITRSIFGSFFQFGFYYSIAGYTIYFGEVIFELFVLVLLAALCIFAKKMSVIIQTVLAFVLIFGIIFCFAKCFSNDSFLPVFNHAFSVQKTMNKPFTQILSIAALSPWAFVGFESLSHSSHEFRFSLKKSFLIMAFALVAGFVAYVSLTFLAVPSYNLVNMSVFFSVKNFAFKSGFFVLSLAVFAAILTGIIGNFIAASRLLFAMANDGILPPVLKKCGSNSVPKNAILLITVVSAFIPFLGRTAIGWIVDVTTIGAAIAYGYTSASVFKTARAEGSVFYQITGLLGGLASVFFSLFLLVPNLWSINALSSESYLILAFWSIIGFFYFRTVFSHDKEHRFGKSTVVWLALLFLIFFTSVMWMRLQTHKTAEKVLSDINTFYIDEMNWRGIATDKDFELSSENFLNNKLNIILDALLNNSLVQMLIIVIALAIMFSVYSRMTSREKRLEKEKIEAHRANEAKTTFLSNMSHDIRTPMNAIIGYTKLALREGTNEAEIRDFLLKIDSSSKHLLALINDVLEMSRIESGKMELEENSADLREILKEIENVFVMQMNSKQIDFKVSFENLKNPFVMCDKNRLNRVLLNLIGNAYKFTREGGKVSVTLSQISETEGNADYELRVSDNGIGMSKEFAERVFEPFEREQTSTVSGIQGTGLGMAITKNIIDLMGGEISVQTESGKGTEFVIKLNLKTQTESPHHTNLEKINSPLENHETISENEDKEIDFSKKRLLLVDDVEVNREIAKMLLEEMGFTIETATNGKEALEKVQSDEHGFDAVLMDIQMPVLDGYEATKRIRTLSEPKKSSVPIVAMTANAFEEDKRNAFESGMNAHVAKPIDEEQLVSVLKSVLRK